MACVQLVSFVSAFAGAVVLVPALIRRIRPRVLRRATGWITVLATVGAAPFVGLLLLLTAILAVGLGATVLETAPDGRTILVTQDGFDGEFVGIYTEYDGSYKSVVIAPGP